MGQWVLRLAALLLLLLRRQGGESPTLTIHLFSLGVVGLCACGGLWTAVQGWSCVCLGLPLCQMGRQ